MMKRCLQGIFYEPLNEIYTDTPYFGSPGKVSEDNDSPLPCYLPGEYAPIPRINKITFWTQRESPEILSELPPKEPEGKYLVPFCENLDICEHSYSAQITESYCTICGKEDVSHQCSNCTVTLCWGCYSRHVHRKTIATHKSKIRC